MKTDERRALVTNLQKRAFMYRADKLAGSKLEGRTFREHRFGRIGSKRENLSPLTAEERHQLRACEKTIREGLGTFVAVGSALMEIRNARLYRQTHPSFEAYVESVLALTRPRAYQLIDSAQVMRDLSTIVDIPALPQNEAQTRELCRWKTPEERVEKWKAVLSVAGDKPVTAKFIRQTLSPAPASKTEGVLGPNRRITGCLTRLRQLLDGNPVEAKALKLVSRLEELVSEKNEESAAPAAEQKDFWLPGFGM